MLRHEPDAPLLAEDATLTAWARAALPSEAVTLLPVTGPAPASLLVAATVAAAEAARRAGVPFLLDARRDAGARHLADLGLLDRAFWDAGTLEVRLREWVDRRGRGAAGSVERREAMALAWLEGVRAEALMEQEEGVRAREEAERRGREAEEQRARHLARLEAELEEARERAARFAARLAAIEATRAWRAYQLLRGVRRRLGPGGSARSAPPPAPAAPPRPEDGAPEAPPPPVAPPPARPPEPPPVAAATVDLLAAQAPALPPGALPGVSLRVHRIDEGGPLRAAGDGEFVAVLDPDARLVPEGLEAAVDALRTGQFDAVLTAEAADGSAGAPRSMWGPVQARAWALASGLVVLRRGLVERSGGFRSEAGWEAAHDLLLRAGADAAVGSVAAIGCLRAGPLGPLRPRPGLLRTLAAHPPDGDGAAACEPDPAAPGAVRWRRSGPRPRVSVIVPTRDRPELLEQLLDGLARTAAPGVELVLVDNRTRDPRARTVLEREGHVVVRADCDFNFSRLVNRGAAAAGGELLILLNNDVSVADPHWAEALAEVAMAPGAGPVGPLLRYPDGTIQHCGLAIGPDGVPAHVLAGLAVEAAPATLVRAPQERTAVTAACMAVRAELFWRLGGFEPLLAHGYNDVDFCLRAAGLGHPAVYTPHTELLHLESASRGRDWTPALAADWLMFRSRWRAALEAPDPWWPPGVSLADGRPAVG